MNIFTSHSARASRRARRAAQSARPASHALGRQFGFETLELRTLLAADLQIQQAAVPAANVAPGQLLDYTITIHNAGDAAASAANDTFTDTLPSNVTLISASASQGNIATATDTSVVGGVGTLAAGASDTIHVRVTPNTGAAGVLTNTASVSGDDADTNAANNSASVNSVAAPGVTPVDIAVSGTSTVDGSAAFFGTPVDANNANTNPGNSNAAVVGQDITYNFTVTNNDATNAASNVQLTDMIPADSLYLTSAASQGTVSVVNGVVTANLGSLAAGASATVTVDLSPTAAGADSSTAGLTDSAYATTDSGDSDLTNNSASVGSLVDSVSNTTPNGNTGTTAANLTITKTDSTGMSGAVPGQAVTYTISVTNNGTSPLTGYAINTELFDTLPSGVTFISALSDAASGGGVQFNNGTVTDQLSDMLPGASATLTIVVSPNAATAGAVTNQVVATSDSGFVDPTTQIADDTFSVAAAGAGAASLAVTKTDSSATSGGVAPGQAVTYTIVVSNTGATNAADNVLLTDNLPNGLTYISASSAAGGTTGGPAGAIIQNNGSVTDTIGTLAPGQNVTLTLMASPTLSGTIGNTATATTSTGVDGASTPSATDTFTVGPTAAGAANLSITKLHSPIGQTITVGQPVTYTVLVANNGATPATNVVVTDNFPAGITYASSSSSVSSAGGGSSNTGTIAQSGGDYTDTIAALPAGQTATLTLQGSPNQGGTIANRATVTTSSGLDFGSGASNVATDSLSVPTPDNVSVIGTQMAAGVALDSSNPALIGQDVTYTFVVTNDSSTASAGGVVLTDTLPTNAAVLSYSSDTGAVSESSGTLTADLGTLAAGASATVTVDVSPNAAGTFTNTASVTTDNGDNNPNASSTLTAAVNAASSPTAANLTITKTDSVGASGTITPGQPVTYTITVTNNATDPNTGTANNVVLRDTLPSGVTFVSASPAAGTFGNTGSVTESNGTIVDALGDIVPGQVEALTVVVTPNAAGTVTNTASVTSDSGFANASSETASDTFTAGAAPSGAAHLVVTKADSVGATGSIVPGQPVTYTITVANTGATNSASNVLLTDSLPAGLSYVSASSAAGSASGSPAGTVVQTSGVVTDTVGTLAAGQSTTLTLVASPTQSGTISNTAVATTSSGVDNTSTPAATDNLAVGAAGTGAADLSIAVLHSPVGQPIVVGEQVTETIAVNNSGSTDASNVVVTDNLPAGVTYDSSSSSVSSSSGTPIAGAAAGATTNTDGNATDTIGTLPAGQTATFAVVLTPTQPGNVVNQASVTTSSGLSDPSGDVGTDSFAVAAPANVSVTGSVMSGGAPTDSNNPATVGEDVTFTFVVTNNSATDSAGNVLLTDMVPTGATFLSASASQGTVSQTAGALTVNLGALPAGGTATVTVDLSPNTAGTLTDTASVTTETGNSNPNRSATVTAAVNAATSASAANLTVTKTDSVGASGTITPGQLVTYTITVTNNATDPNTGTANNVNVYDALPAGVTFVSAAPAAGTFGNTGSVTESNGTITDSLSDMVPGETEVLTIVVSPNAAGTVTNTAVVTSDSGFANASSQTASDNLTVSPAASTAADLAVTKTDSVGGAGAVPGQPVAYTVTVTNNSTTNAANNVVLTDSLPAGLTYVSSTSAAGSASGSPAGTAGQANGLVTDTIGTLATGQSTTLTMIAVPTQSGSISNTAVATTSSGLLNAAGAVATDVLNVNPVPTTAADLSITKVDSAVGMVITPGQPVTYTITVSNNSAANAASNVAVTDNLPASVTYGSSMSSLSASGGSTPTGAAAGTTANTSGTVTDTIPALAAGQSATFQIVVTPTQAGAISNTATVTTSSGTVAGDTLSDTDTFSVAPAPPATADLTISNLGTPNPATVGQPLTYTITVINNGGAAADNLVVTDPLPSGATFSSDTSSAGTVTQSNGTVTANLGSIAAGATDTVTIVVTPTQTGTLSNTASLTTSSTNANTTTTATSSVMVGAATASGASLSIGDSASPSPGTVGQSLTYTITVNNSGSADAANVVVTDTLPAGLTYVSNTTSAGSASFSNGTVTANLGTVAAGATDTLTIVVTPTQEGTLNNIASLTTSSTDSNPITSVSVLTQIYGSSPTPTTGTVGYLAGQPGDGTDATFIQNLYRELLGREPDAGGQSFYLSILQSGGSDAAARLRAINDFVGSLEYRQHLVNTIYENFLGRVADAGGLQFWVGQLADGAGERGVLAGIIGSHEYLADNGGDSQGFVTGLYRDLLGRTPDAGGQTFWVGQADDNSNSLARVVEGFLGTPEAEHKLLDGNYETLTGAVSPAAAGSPAGGHYALADITGNGWENLYFQGNLNASAADQYFGQLQADDSYEMVIENLLDSSTYFNAAS